jgi:hypothetical protein
MQLTDGIRDTRCAIHFIDLYSPVVPCAETMLQLMSELMLQLMSEFCACVQGTRALRHAVYCFRHGVCV